MVRLLTRSHLQLVAAADKLEDKQAPSAQSSAKFMWALVTLDPSAATQDVMDIVPVHFAGLTCSSDVRQRPTAQNIANVMWASAHLQNTYLVPSKLLDPICASFAHFLRGPDARQHPTAQDCSIIVWSQATVVYPAPAKLLNAICAHFACIWLISSCDAVQRPNAQECANMSWALAEMRHRPPDAAASTMLQRLVAACDEAGQQPEPQAISNCLIACAELRLRLTQPQTHVMLSTLLGQCASVLQSCLGSSCHAAPGCQSSYCPVEQAEQQARTSFWASWCLRTTCWLTDIGHSPTLSGSGMAEAAAKLRSHGQLVQAALKATINGARSQTLGTISPRSYRAACCFEQAKAILPLSGAVWDVSGRCHALQGWHWWCSGHLHDRVPRGLCGECTRQVRH